jgi:hypothetical protein
MQTWAYGKHVSTQKKILEKILQNVITRSLRRKSNSNSVERIRCTIREDAEYLVIVRGRTTASRVR